MSTLISAPPAAANPPAAQFVHAATARGEPCAMFLFEEARSKLLNRADSVGKALQAALDTGLLSAQQIDRPS